MSNEKKITSENKLKKGDLSNLVQWDREDYDKYFPDELFYYFERFKFDDVYGLREEAIELWNALFEQMSECGDIEEGSPKAEFIQESIGFGYYIAVEAIAKMQGIPLKKLENQLSDFEDAQRDRKKKAKTKKVKVKAKKSEATA